MQWLNRNVVALYVNPKGPYPKLLAYWYDKEIDATTYNGNLPVIAHPPCGPWGKMRQFCTKQDKTLGETAVKQVQWHNGILEHPKGSTLFKHCELPPPNKSDKKGGWTIEVNQVAWGHSCQKSTWLYIIGTPQSMVIPFIRKGGIATHVIKTSITKPWKKLPETTRINRELTPIAFARWLIGIATWDDKLIQNPFEPITNETQ